MNPSGSGCGRRYDIKHLMVTPASDQRVDPASGSSPSVTRSDSNPDRVCPIDFIRGRFRVQSARTSYCFFAIVGGAPESDLSPLL